MDDWDDIPRKIPDFHPWLFTKSAPTLYTDVQYQPGDALVFGAETRGLPPAVLIDRYPDRAVRIPTGPRVPHSLNLSNAAAVAAYEAIRQWGCRGTERTPQG